MRGAFHTTDAQGFFMASNDGAPDAAISVIDQDAGHAFPGLYLCRPGWRGQAIGCRLGTDALGHAGARSVWLDGVPVQQANYRKPRFVQVGASLRHESPLSIGLSAANTALRIELEGAGFTEHFVTARMYRGAGPETGTGLQAIATMDLG
jgi:hypothetical protein